LRFWNHEVMGNLEGVLEAILQVMQARALSPAPSPASGRGESHGPAPSPASGRGEVPEGSA
jgi:hypothetical protein